MEDKVVSAGQICKMSVMYNMPCNVNEEKNNFIGLSIQKIGRPIHPRFLSVSRGNWISAPIFVYKISARAGKTFFGISEE
jgi:hypothetical protein